MALTAEMVTALAAKEALVFHAVEIVLAAGTVRLLDGAGSLTFSSKTFTGKDATYGMLGGIEPVREEIGLEASRLRLLVLPPSTSAVTTLMAEANQGGAVSIWMGCITRSTGAVVADPELLFTGFYDTAKAVGGRNSLSVEIDVASDWERFFTAEEGARLNTAWHQSIWTGELGLDFVIDSQRDPFWGTKDPAEIASIQGISAAGGTTTTGRPVIGGV